MIPVEGAAGWRLKNNELGQIANVSPDWIMDEWFLKRELILWAFMADIWMVKGALRCCFKTLSGLKRFHTISNPLQRKRETSYAGYGQWQFEKGAIKRDRLSASQQQYRSHKKEDTLTKFKTLMKLQQFWEVSCQSWQMEVAVLLI